MERRRDVLSGQGASRLFGTGRDEKNRKIPRAARAGFAGEILDGKFRNRRDCALRRILAAVGPGDHELAGLRRLQPDRLGSGSKTGRCSPASGGLPRISVRFRRRGRYELQLERRSMLGNLRPRLLRMLQDGNQHLPLLQSGPVTAGTARTSRLAKAARRCRWSRRSGFQEFRHRRQQPLDGKRLVEEARVRIRRGGCGQLLVGGVAGDEEDWQVRPAEAEALGQFFA